MSDSGSANTTSLAFVEGLYADYLNDPASVSDDWRAYFEKEAAASSDTQLGPSFKPRSVFNAPGVNFVPPVVTKQPTNGAAARNGAAALALQDRVDALVRAYRVRGHMMAQIDPLGLPRASQPELDPAFYDLDASEMDKVFSSRTIFGAETLTLREIIQRLSATYCRSIGVLVFSPARS
jgi:2-oxoglutarate dehydrogenase E1 component